MDNPNHCPRIDPAVLLQMLRSDDVEAQRHALLVVCPCRNRYYDKEIWRAIFAVRDTGTDGKARERAHHVIGTLQERTRFDMRSLELLNWLKAQGYRVFIPPWLQRQFRKNGAGAHGPRLPKVISRDVPALIEALASDDPEEQKQALQVFCPGRARQYKKRIWLALFRTCNSTDPKLGSESRIAANRLLAHAIGDPRAQEVLEWLRRELRGSEVEEDYPLMEDLTWAPDRPFSRSANLARYGREHPALRAPAIGDFSDPMVDRLIEAVRTSQRSRDLRMALHALGQAGSPRATAVLQEYGNHPEESIRKLARSMLH
ncbi:MAG TPA: hypothetical protein VKT32_09115 [Chthonomonadaceae bacterium]|nr:hypothetical protein [Chthonomonadaceae bacterium]